ncbi:hypothetical protein KL921_004935 [Ogataea angusta]|nr:hypothetical protein KL921_004935 [Ogataea angusta]
MKNFLVLASFAALLATSNGAAVVKRDDIDFEELEHYWSYGRSEPVYPSPQISGVDDWAEALNMAKALVDQMTNEEKNNVTYGYSVTTTGCSGMSGSVPRLNFPGLCLQDAGNGVRGTDMVNSYPAGLHVGASWNKGLAYERSLHMGGEFRNKGVNVALGPVTGPVGKIARGGRNWEGFSNDPYLSGALTGETIRGLQESVIACVKHLVAYEQEASRNPQFGLIEGTHNQSISSNVDDKTMHELYMWPFQDAIKAGAGSVMCSYNRINNSYACENSKVMNGLLKEELAFQGFVVSDWDAQHSGIASAESGLDLAMPDSVFWENGTLVEAINNGTMAQSRLDDMVTRIVAAWYKLAEIEDPGFGLPYDLTQPHDLVDARDPASADTILQGAVEGHVLLKNKDNALPLKKPRALGLYGYDATASARNFLLGTSLELWNFGLTNTLTYSNGTDINIEDIWRLFLSSYDPTQSGPDVALNGTFFVGSGSGANTPSYVDAPYDAFVRQAKQDGTWLSWNFIDQDPKVNGGNDACIVFINDASSEGWDRPTLRDDYSDELVKNVASKCSNTIVVVHNAGVRIVDSWIDHENVTALVFAHLPGQDSGQALIDVLYGNQSPSGRLPYTVAKNESDYGSLLSPIVPEGTVDQYYPQDNFTEGLYIDYKHFLKYNITPRYEFGYGLTYTTFDYANISITKQGADTAQFPPEATLVQGGNPNLWEVVATVTCDVTNSGNVTAAEVAQLYVEIPNGPGRVLRGFDKVSIAPGETQTFVFDLTRRDLSTWDVENQNWALQQGDYAVYVGKSVLDIQLTGTLSI